MFIIYDQNSYFANGYRMFITISYLPDNLADLIQKVKATQILLYNHNI